jgi:hypothetical protein
MSRAPRLAAADPFLSDGESFKLALLGRACPVLLLPELVKQPCWSGARRAISDFSPQCACKADTKCRLVQMMMSGAPDQIPL